MRKAFCLILVLFILKISSSLAEPARNDMLLYLSFDEGAGSVIRDASGRLPDGNVRYQFLTSADPMDPQWRDTGVENGSLLFDG